MAAAAVKHAGGPATGAAGCSGGTVAPCQGLGLGLGGNPHLNPVLNPYLPEQGQAFQIVAKWTINGLPEQGQASQIVAKCTINGLPEQGQGRS
jgi:hypothetical protein